MLEIGPNLTQAIFAITVCAASAFLAWLILKQRS